MSFPHPSPSDWAPLTLADTAEQFAGAPFRWWFAGGLALELHVGKTWQQLGDTDVGVLRSDAAAVHDWFEGWDLWIAHAGALTSWRGAPLQADRAHNNVWAHRPGDDRWSLDILFGDGDSAEWRYRRDLDIARSWDRAVLVNPSGLPYLAPDLQLLFKSKNPRAKDHRDAAAVVPQLTPDERAFLREALAPEHPWRSLLG